MNFTESVNYFIGLLHTLVRFLPLGVYFFAYFSSAIYKDIRSAILLIGLIVNDLVGYLYKRYSSFSPNENCAVFDKSDNESELGFLPNSHTEFISFISTFYFTDMYYKENLDVIPFTSLIVMIFLTVWSRVTIKCEKFNDIVFNLIFGIIWGLIFYYFVKDYYLNAEKGLLEKETCDLGYDNYNCSEIKDGTVILKK
jgi:hypothetical protein